MASNLLRRRWSEKAWGKGGAHEMNRRNLGSPSGAYWLPSLTKEDRILYESKHSVPSPPNPARLSTTDVLEEKQDLNFVSGDCWCFMAIFK